MKILQVTDIVSSSERRMDRRQGRLAAGRRPRGLEGGTGENFRGLELGSAARCCPAGSPY